MSLLEVDDLRAGYGFLPVLQGISFSVDEGSMAVILGLNGAGKSTTLNVIAGLVPAWSGTIRLDGEDVTRLRPAQLVARGVALVHEGRRVFPGLTVRRNLELGAWTRRRGMRERLDQVFAHLPRLDERSGQLAGTLSGGEQQMLAIGRALMAQPRLLMIDEASLGLAPTLAETVFRIMGDINRDGTTLLVVEQNVGILPYADQALVMEKGSLTFAGPRPQLESSGDLRRSLLG
jgi:branched-chain amino acid transport system ATP-binding protein